jgi:RNA polymerase sigma-70 factor (ECF subfamily)
MSPANEPLNAEKLEALYAALEKPMFNVAYRWLWNVEEARDVVQEAFVRVWERRGRVKLETVEPLLFKVAVNLAANRRRARRLRALVGLGEVEETPAAGPGAQAQLEAHEREVQVRRAVEALPEKLKQAVMLCRLSGLSQAQVAEALGIPEGTVASRLHLATKQLKEVLG